MDQDRYRCWECTKITSVHVAVDDEVLSLSRAAKRPDVIRSICIVFPVPHWLVTFLATRLMESHEHSASREFE